MNPRGPLSLRRMSAHWVVLAAAALTTLVAAAVAAALAAFAGQALPQAVRHDLVVAQGTSMDVSGTFAGGSPAQTSAALHSTIAGTLDGVPFGFWQGIWSDPLGFEAGSLPAKPASASTNTPLLQAASLQGVTDHAVLAERPVALAGGRGAGRLGRVREGRQGGGGGRKARSRPRCPRARPRCSGCTPGTSSTWWTGTPTRR